MAEQAARQGLPTRKAVQGGRTVLKDDDHLKKISWKNVAADMSSKGSYLYGNATVKKKYGEVREIELQRR